MRKKTVTWWNTALLTGLLAGSLSGQTLASGGSTALPKVTTPATLSLTPSVVIMKVKPGQSVSRALQIVNQTPAEFTFEMVAFDVVLRDGKRVFVPAGEVPGSVAASAVFSTKQVTVKPGEQTSVQATFTIPSTTDLRAVVAMFRGVERPATTGQVQLVASLGSLLTFTLSDNYQVAGQPVRVAQQTETSNLRVIQELRNTGSEAVIPKGAAALLDEGGRRIGTATFAPHRLLPGERLDFQADYPAQLKPGLYRVVVAFEFEGRTITNVTEFAVL